MSKRPILHDAVLDALVQGPERSPLFWWMYNRHAALERTWAGQRVNWLNFCSQMAAIGITDQTGKPPTRPTAVKTWDRVRQQKAREQAARDKRQRARARESERGKNADRPPPVVAISAPRPPVPSYPPPVLPPPKPLLEPAIASRPHEELSEEEREAYAKAQILRLRRRFAEASGHDPDEIK